MFVYKPKNVKTAKQIEPKTIEVTNMTQGKVYGGLKLNNYMPGKNDKIHYMCTNVKMGRDMPLKHCNT